MKRSGRRNILYGVLLASLGPTGCALLSPTKMESPPGREAVANRPSHVAPQASVGNPSDVILASHVEQAPAPAETAPPARPFTDDDVLSVKLLVEQVLARNPSLAQMVAAWQAASARYPQVVSLDDPSFAVTLGPTTYGSTTVDPAYRIELSQKYPFPGKLALKGKNAEAEAAAASDDVEDMSLQLIESAQSAFYDYYLVARAVEVNEEGLVLLHDFRKNANTRYTTAQGAQQDILQADVEIGRLHERGLLLERMRLVAIARINTLLNLEPDMPLPRPPKRITVVDGIPEAKILREEALARRPDLKALANRIAAEEALLSLAHKEYCPDFEPFVMYDRFMGNTAAIADLATMMGVRMNLPVRYARRRGAVAEAEAKISQRRAELDKLINQVNFDVQQAHAQVHESESVVRLYEKEVLPASRSNVKTAQAEYLVGKVPFVSLIEAQRNLIALQDRFHEATADYFRRRATLERVVGGAITAAH